MAKGIYVGVGDVARKVKKMYVGVERTLPSGYTQVSHIESTGTQYIDTGFKPNQNTRIVMVAELTAVSDSTQTAVFGARSANTNQFWLYWRYNNLRFAFRYGSNSTNNLAGDIALAKHVFDANKNVLSVSGETVTAANATFACSCNAYLLAINNDGETQYPASIKLYSCQIYDNGTLVRDFVPCTNSNGVAGLYDVVGNTFYTNAGTGTFVVGSPLQSVARKVKKAYIGIGGIARPCFGSGELAYYGTITSLSVARSRLSAATVGNYALFCGGRSGSTTNESSVDAYDTSLTRTSATQLVEPRYEMAATSFGGYALFGGGMRTLFVYSAKLDVYDTSLTHTNPSTLNLALHGVGATTVGNYALFGGGQGTTNSSNVYAFDTAFTRTTAEKLSSGRSLMGATTVGNYALFAGGRVSSDKSDVDAYDSSLTRTNPTALSVARSRLSATTIGNYALFGGGSDMNIVDAYDASLTRKTAAALSFMVRELAATTINNYALFGGGYCDSDGLWYRTVDAYDASLTRTSATELSEARSGLAATTVGNYALFAGGETETSDMTAVVDAYTVA